jgi:hypothetical protein
LAFAVHIVQGCPVLFEDPRNVLPHDWAEALQYPVSPFYIPPWAILPLKLSAPSSLCPPPRPHASVPHLTPPLLIHPTSPHTMQPPLTDEC